MHIKTTCPRCESTFQLEPSLLGQRIRCPACRRSFVVEESADTPPAPAPAAPASPASGNVRTGSVGDIVPILEAKSAAGPPTPANSCEPEPLPQAIVLEPIVPMLPVEPAGPVEPAPPPKRRPRPQPPAPPSAGKVRRALRLIAEAGLDGDPEIKQRRARLPEAHRQSIPYVAVADLQAQDALAEDRAPSLLVSPYLNRGRVAVAEPRPVLAQARGVLHAFEPDSGRLRWAVRVRPEATALPRWLPRTPLAPDQVLVLSPDSLTLSALDADSGATRWSRKLAMPCLAGPVVVGDRAFVPGYGGRVEEIEVNSGALRGYCELNGRLTVGGVGQPGTSLVYFPADGFCVYVLDVASRRCAAVLYTGHPGGSLLSTPVVLPGPPRPAAEGEAPSAGGSLLLAQAAGLDAMQLRAFALPAAEAEAPAVQPDGFAPRVRPRPAVRAADRRHGAAARAGMPPLTATVAMIPAVGKPYGCPGNTRP